MNKTPDNPKIDNISIKDFEKFIKENGSHILEKNISAVFIRF